jgi:16S rRNA processing protein RimM
MSDKLEIAKLGRTVGLNGTLKLHLLTDFPDQFKKGRTFETKRGELIVKKYDPLKEQIQFEHYSTKEEAAALTNVILLSTFEQTRHYCNLEKDEYFWFDIIGSTLVEENKPIGVIKDIERYGIDNHLVIETDPVLVEAGRPKRFLFPYNKHTIGEVNLEAKEIQAIGALDILELL